MPQKSLAPQQARSRESLRRLLKAATEVLGQHGVEGATIPRVAARAGLSPGAVYRRFRDKDALFEAVILRILERQDEHLRQSLTTEAVSQMPLAVFTDQLFGRLVASYRVNAPLLRALRQVVQDKAHTPFWRRASRLEVRTLEHLVDVVMTHAAEIAHPQPRLAISTGLLMVTSTLQELVVMPTDLGPMKAFLPPDDQALKRELVRSFLAYLTTKGTDARTTNDASTAVQRPVRSKGGRTS